MSLPPPYPPLECCCCCCLAFALNTLHFLGVWCITVLLILCPLSYLNLFAVFIHCFLGFACIGFLPIVIFCYIILALVWLLLRFCVIVWNNDSDILLSCSVRYLEGLAGIWMLTSFENIKKLKICLVSWNFFFYLKNQLWNEILTFNLLVGSFVY